MMQDTKARNDEEDEATKYELWKLKDILKDQ